MNDLALAVDERRQSNPVARVNYGEALALARRRQAGVDPATSPADSPRSIVFLDTLAQDIGQALALIQHAALLPRKQTGWYFRLGDVREALTLIEQAGLLPRTKPDWYLRLQEFARQIP
jgi:hypothetical protein